MATPQTQLNIPEPVESVETYEFEPIQGYPMLRWKGKRDLPPMQFYPAQLKETYGEEVDDWRNKIYWGDNLQVMSHLLKTHRGKINLIYIDPPFDSKADYKKKIQLRGRTVENDHTAFEEKQYTDIWTNDEYLQFMYERLILMKELLADNGSIYVHCDWRMNSYLRLVLDEIFGPISFVNEMSWKRYAAHSLSVSGYDAITDTILLYAKNASAVTFNIQYGDTSEDELAKRFPYKEKETGRIYQHAALEKSSNSSSRGEARIIGDRTVISGIGWIWTQETFDERLEDNPYLIHWTGNGRPRYKIYADEYAGSPLGDIWTDINYLSAGDSQRLNYPTQKPEALLGRIIKTSSNPGDLVFDCFMGSGTTQAVAMKLGRRFIGADINLGAVETTTKRLLEIQKNAEQGEIDLQREDTEAPKTVYTGFEIYNVNNYDVFRNEEEAKDLLIEALEIQPLPTGGIYDGEKDGHMVKIMPINRIATRADLGELITGFDYRAFQRQQEKNPTQPVEKLLLVCMGHESDLAAALQDEVPYNLEIEVMDILRQKSELEFKRESEAKIVRRDGSLIIEQFYPMNLLQKLSILKENIENWQELVESVKVDFNYDGAVMNPSVIDSSEEDELVKGTYPIPEDAGTIRVKITDLLSESLEETVE